LEDSEQFHENDSTKFIIKGLLGDMNNEDQNIYESFQKHQSPSKFE